MDKQETYIIEHSLICKVNPKIMNLEWHSDYKLRRLMLEQLKRTSPEELMEFFGGGPDFFQLEEAFKEFNDSQIDFNEESLDSS